MGFRETRHENAGHAGVLAVCRPPNTASDLTAQACSPDMLRPVNGLLLDATSGRLVMFAAMAIVLGGCTAITAAPTPSATDVNSGSSSGFTSGAVEREYPFDASSAYTWNPPAPGTPVVAVGADAVPVAQDAGYAAALERFGVEAVQTAIEDDVVIARTALADCQRRTTGVMSPNIISRLDPVLLAWVEERLAGPPGYPPPLLSELPDDDGNGNDLAAAVQEGCSADGPMRFGPEPLTVRVEGDELVVAGSYALTVSFGDLDVGAGQDWILTSYPTGQGWALVDAVPSANTNWHPAP